MREAWLEAAGRHIPEETLRRIPEGGIPLHSLEQAVRGTPMEAVCMAAKWIWSTTGNPFLDQQFPDDFDYQFQDDWDNITIRNASNEWQNAEAMLKPVDRLVSWLEEDLPERFREMLDTVLARMEETAAGEMKDPTEEI